MTTTTHPRTEPLHPSVLPSPPKGTRDQWENRDIRSEIESPSTASTVDVENGRSVESGNIGPNVYVHGHYVHGTNDVRCSYVTNHPCSVSRGKVGDTVFVDGKYITGKGDVSCPVLRPLCRGLRPYLVTGRVGLTETEKEEDRTDRSGHRS